jgi:hypothetical protein
VSTCVTLPLDQRIQLFVNAVPAERYIVKVLNASHPRNVTLTGPMGSTLSSIKITVPANHQPSTVTSYAGRRAKGRACAAGVV